MWRMKYFKFKNFKHVTCFTCPECEERKEIIIDDLHGEIICLKCGLVLSQVRKYQ